MQGTVLGTLRILDGERSLDLPSGQVGRLLELFLLRPDHPFGTDELVEALWDDRPEPDVGRRRLRVTISRLRSFLGDDESGSPDDLHVTRDEDTYRLSTSPACLDRRRFEEAATRAIASGRADDLEAALGEWGGEPYPSVGWPDVAAEERATLMALHQQLVSARLTTEGGFARTKLRAPITTHLHVERPRLLDRLPAPGAGSAFSVVAPAGFGKSTLLAQWAGRHGQTAWMGLDRDDVDSARLWTLLTRSLIVAGAIEPTTDTLDATTVPALLASSADHVAVVIDDAHVIDEPEAVAALVETAGESDLQSGWYRLHYGVAHELRRRAASRVDLDRVQRRAARWCRERGLTAAALDYAVEGGDTDIVARTAGDVVLDTVLRREVSATTRMLRRIDPAMIESDYRSHAICTTVALIWCAQEAQTRWAHSRRRAFGEDDPVVLMDRARSSLDSGDGKLALELSERLEVKFDEAVDESVRDLVPLFRLLANEFPVRAKAMMLSALHDDPIFAETVNVVRQSLPLVAAWIYEAWAWVALLDGNETLARSLAEEFHQLRMTIVMSEVLSREQTTIGAMFAGMDTDDPERLRRLGEGLENSCEFFSVRGNWVSLGTSRLVAAHLYRRAGVLDKADEYDGLADASIRTLGDTPMLVALRKRLAADDPETSFTSLLLWQMTPRQREVVPHLLSGDPIATIAERLHISVNTLNGHLQAIYQRLGVSTRAAAVARLASIDLRRFDDPTPAEDRSAAH